MTQIAPKAKTAVARPLKVLVPLIKEELAAADAAGLEHYRRVGEMLLEAREQLTYGSWTQWLSKNFELSRVTAWRYMKLAERAESVGGRSGPETTLYAAIGEKPSDWVRRVGAFQPLRDLTARVDVGRLAAERQRTEDEVQLRREMALDYVVAGYRAMAMRLHPDKGGSREGMQRLNAIRDEFKHVAETRRFL